MFRVPDKDLVGNAVVQIPLHPNAMFYLQRYPDHKVLGQPREVGGVLVPVRGAAGVRVEEALPDMQDAGAQYATVNVSNTWPLSFHSHASSCVDIGRGRQECAIFTPSGTDFKELFGNPRNVAHVVACEHGIYCINSGLHFGLGDRGAKEAVAAEIEGMQAKFAKARESDARYHVRYMNRLADLGLCVEFFPWGCAGDPARPPRILVPAERMGEVMGAPYPPESAWEDRLGGLQRRPQNPRST